MLRSTCRLFQFAYEGDFRSLCTVKVDFQISNTPTQCWISLLSIFHFHYCTKTKYAFYGEWVWRPPNYATPMYFWHQKAELQGFLLRYSFFCTTNSSFRIFLKKIFRFFGELRGWKWIIIFHCGALELGTIWYLSAVL